MNNDPIAGMTTDEIHHECHILVGSTYVSDGHLIGRMIEKLQEWKCLFTHYPTGHAYGNNWWIRCDCRPVIESTDRSLQVAFLRTAHALGHWTPHRK